MTTRAPKSHATALRPEPEACYWAALDAPARGGRDAARFAFEAWTPAPIDEVECRFIPTPAPGIVPAPAPGIIASPGDGAPALGTPGAPQQPRRAARVLACGIDKDALARMIERGEADGAVVESVRPARLPACVVEALGLDEPAASALLSALEFRVGAFESPRRARRRRSAVRTLAVAAAIVSALVSVGWLRAAVAARDAASAARAASASVASDALGPAAGAAAALDPAVRLSAELRRLERTRDPRARAALPDDRSGTFAALLAAWPAGMPVRVEDAQLDQDTITLRVQTRDAADAERLAVALSAAMDGWREESRTVMRAREGYGCTIVLRRHRGEEGGAR